MSAELIRRRPDQPPSPALTSRIIDNLESANTMIEDLLDASKIRAGQKITSQIQHIDLVQIVSSTLENLSTIHGDRFKLQSPDKVEVWLSPNGMRRIIENLCSNAIKYGSPIDPVIVVIEPGQNQISLLVHNKGHQLNPIDRNKLFEPFERGSSVEIAGKKGWGIGLTIVKGITEAHEGEVSVDATDDGTTFKIKLPMDARNLTYTSEGK
jgi:signal transduction histidine kinase